MRATTVANVTGCGRDCKPPVSTALLSGTDVILEMLLSKGAVLETNTENFFMAIAGDRTTIVEKMLKDGIDPNYGNLCGATAIETARMCKHEQIEKLLSEYGAK